MLRIIEGFDYFSDVGDALVGPQVSRQGNLPTGFIPSFVPGRFGGKALLMGGNTNTIPERSGLRLLSNEVIPTGTPMVLGLAFTPGRTAQTTVIALQDEEANQTVRIDMNTLEQLGVFKDDTTIIPHSLDTEILGNGWSYIELEVLVAVNGYYRLYVDGTLRGEFNGDTLTEGTGVVHSILIGTSSDRQSSSQSANLGLYDDIYLLDGTGSRNNSRLGDSRVELLDIATATSTMGLSVPALPLLDHITDYNELGDTAFLTSTASNQTVQAEVVTGFTEIPADIYGASFNYSARKSTANNLGFTMSVTSPTGSLVSPTIGTGEEFNNVSLLTENIPGTNNALTPAALDGISVVVTSADLI